MEPNQEDIIYYLQAEFDVRRENHLAFKAIMKRLLSVIFDLHGWELVHASYPISGRVNRFTHIWHIPEPASVLHVMRQGAFDDWAGSFLPDSGAARAGAASDAGAREAESRTTPGGGVTERARHNGYGEPSPLATPITPEQKQHRLEKIENDKIRRIREARYRYFTRLYREIQGVVENSTHALSTSLPTDPIHAGYQTETLLIDVNEKLFVLPHSAMREKWVDLDIRNELASVRAARGDRLWGEGDEEAMVVSALTRPHVSHLDRPRDMQAYVELVGRLRDIEMARADAEGRANADAELEMAQLNDLPCRPELEPAVDYKPIQDLLDEGITQASVKLHQVEQVPFFNLSALKPRPVLQQSFDITKAVDPSQVPTIFSPETEPQPGEGDAPLDDGRKLLIATPWGGVYHVNRKDIREIALQLSGPVLAATEKRVELIKRHRASMASVLDPRGEVIGDGCVCYVINLSAVPLCTHAASHASPSGDCDANNGTSHLTATSVV